MAKKILLIVLSAIIIIALSVTVTIFVYRGCKAEDINETAQEVSEEAEVTEDIEKVTEETGIEEESSQEETEEAVEEEPEEDEEFDEDEEANEEEIEGEVPTISLSIYEGPTLDGSTCYYRIEATVTGSPNPTVSFSKDDSGGAWGTKKAQINLNDPTDTYILTATATNSEGTAINTVDLSWGCEIPEPDPDPDPDSGPIEKTVDIGAHTTISGYIEVGGSIYPGASTLVLGDRIPGIYEHAFITFLSFDISDISSSDDVIIKDVSVTIPISQTIGNPEQLGPAYIYVFYYGNSLNGPLKLIGGELVKTINTTSSLTDFNFSSNELKEELQEQVDKGKWLFQLKIALNIGENDDSSDDYYEIPTSDVILYVKYEVP